MFDSGCSRAALLETRPELHWPAELYLEGSDQHRGWFQSSLLEAMGTRDAPPYKSVVTHGFFVDGEGRKMSKSLGNVIAHDELLPKYGAEILRLWVAAEDYTQDIRVSLEILDRLADAYRRMRNTFRFLLGNLGDFDPARDRQSYARLDEVDRWVLDRLTRLIGRVRRAYDEYECHTVFHDVHNFCAVDLSALYLDIIKDRLYTSLPDDPRRRAAQTVCYDVLSALARLLAPILTFTCEEAWRYLPGAHGESVHLERFPEAPREWLDDTLKRDWDRLLEVRREVAKALETARAGKLIGSGLEAAVRIGHAPEDLPALLSAKRELLPTVFIVSRVALERSGSGASVIYESQDIPGLVIGVDRARGEKCERCWTRSEHVGENRTHPTLCERCVPIVTRLSDSGDPRCSVSYRPRRHARGRRRRSRPDHQADRARSAESGRPRGRSPGLRRPDAGHESRARVRPPLRDPGWLALDRGAPLAGGARRAPARGAQDPAEWRLARAVRHRPHLRRRRVHAGSSTPRRRADRVRVPASARRDSGARVGSALRRVRGRPRARGRQAGRHGRPSGCGALSRDPRSGDSCPRADHRGCRRAAPPGHRTPARQGHLGPSHRRQDERGL